MRDGLCRYGSWRGSMALLASILGSGMAFLDSTAVNVALPALAQELGADFASLQWVVNAYLTTLGALVLTGGALGDVYGRRRVFLVGVVWFALASVLCGLAPDVRTLIAARAIQGIGAALLIPSSLAMVQVGFRPEDRGRAIGAWSGFSGLSTLLGPLLGGWLIDTVSWRAVFLINPGLALLTVVVAMLAIPRDTAPARRRSADAIGGVTAAGGLAGLVFMLIQGPVWGWTHPAVIAGGILGLISSLAFLDIERSQAQPMLPLELFKRRAFVAANGVTVFVYFVLSATFFLLMLQLQRVMGYTAFEAGAAGAPVTLLILVLSPLAGRWADRRGPRGATTLGPIVAAAGVALLAGLEPGGSYTRDVLPGVALLGVGLGLTVAPLTSAALSALDSGDAGLASGVNNAVARVAQLLGIPLLPLAAGLSGLEEGSQAAFAAGFGRAMWVGATILALGGAFAWLGLRGVSVASAGPVKSPPRPSR